MEFALDEEQLGLQSAVRDLIAAHSPLDVVRTVVDSPQSDGVPAGLWARIADQGWPAVLIPQEYGGLGLGLLEAAVITRCLGAGVVPGPVAASMIGGEAIRRAGSAEQQATWLPGLAEGRIRLAVALLRPSAAWDRPGDSVKAAGQTAEGKLTGEIGQVEYAHLADRIVVAAEADDATAEVGLWLVDPASTGVTSTRTPTLDATTRTSTLTLTGVEAERLPGGDPATVADLVSRATVLAANDLVGIARAALTRTVDYLRTREQFGKPIGSFQALKHQLADLLVGLTMAEHAGWYAAHALDAQLPDAALAVSVAKAKASDVARLATARMIQYHGGIGYTWEHETHFFFKRARRLEQTYGDAVQHRARIAALTLDRVP
ncbi:MAG TPA: acyl-CoA dehydrogenase family protein [Kineosporiaceae bacterium]|nr:acyl-CoA dehydrogenase family protein [Kineosporiaceae bacterium]